MRTMLRAPATAKRRLVHNLHPYGSSKRLRDNPKERDGIVNPSFRPTHRRGTCGSLRVLQAFGTCWPAWMTRTLLPHLCESDRLGAVAAPLRFPRACRRTAAPHRAAPDPGLPCQPRVRRGQGRERLQRLRARHPGRSVRPPLPTFGERSPHRARSDEHCRGGQARA